MPTTTPPLCRVLVLVDGYNLYHPIDDLKRHDLKWLDLRALGELLISQDINSSLVDIYYFSAFATWRQAQYARHREYVKALKSRNVKIILGNFKRKDRSCNNCHSEWVAHEEKESDVNIAIRLIDMTHKNTYDKVLIISGDTDLAPALRMVKTIDPQKRITVVLPPRRQAVGSLIAASDNKISISLDMLQRCQLPNEIRDRLGNIICRRPDKYKPIANSEDNVISVAVAATKKKN